MNIQFLENRGQRLISCNFIIQIGTSRTWKDKGSFAHLVEHLLFKGHPRLTQYGLMQQIEGMGGIMNAMTDSMHTEVFIRVTERYLAEVVALVYDAIATFAISEEDVNEEKQIIEIEEEQAYVDEILLNSVLGLDEKKMTGTFSVDELREIYQTYYGTKNWTLLLVGEVSEQTKMKLEQYATSWRNAILGKTEVRIPNVPKYETLIVGEETYFIYYHPCRILCDKVDMKIIKYLLTSGMSSYLYKVLVDDNAYTYQIAFQDLYYDKAAFVIFFSCEENKVDKIRKIFEKLFTASEFMDAMTDEELHRAINMTITEYYLKAESVSSLVQDKIASLLQGKSFVDFNETANSLSEKSAKEVRERIYSLLFAK